MTVPPSGVPADIWSRLAPGVRSGWADLSEDDRAHLLDAAQHTADVPTWDATTAAVDARCAKRRRQRKIRRHRLKVAHRPPGIRLHGAPLAFRERRIARETQRRLLVGAKPNETALKRAPLLEIEPVPLAHGALLVHRRDVSLREIESARDVLGFRIPSPGQRANVASRHLGQHVAAHLERGAVAVEHDLATYADLMLCPLRQE